MTQSAQRKHRSALIWEEQLRPSPAGVRQWPLSPPEPCSAQHPTREAPGHNCPACFLFPNHGRATCPHGHHIRSLAERTSSRGLSVTAATSKCRKARRRWRGRHPLRFSSVHCLQDNEHAGAFPLLGDSPQGTRAAPVCWTAAAALPTLSLRYASSPSVLNAFHGSDALHREESI